MIQKKTIHYAIFTLLSIIWLGFCLTFLVPQFRIQYLGLAQKFLDSFGKFISQDRIEKSITMASFLGIAFYFLVLFLLFLENFIINSENFKKLNLRFLFISIISILAIIIRIAGFGQITGDFNTQSEWVTYLRNNRHFFGFNNFPGNYNAIYMYFLGILSYLPISAELFAMKFISCIFDFLCAYYSLKILELISGNKKIGIIAFTVILFSPTVFLNSGVWAQCDSMYASFLLISLYYLLKTKFRLAMIMYGIGFSFKLQAVFMLPFIIFIFIYKKTSLKYFLFILIGLIAVSIPAWLFGWPLIRIFYNYFAGTNINGVLTLNAPTIFIWGQIPGMIPVIFILSVLICIGFLIIHSQSIPSHNTLLLLFLFCNFVIPFFLPNMHERYFYVGEIAVLLYIIINPARFLIAVAVIFPAMVTYVNYLWHTNSFTLLQMSVIMLIAVIFITKWLIESITADQKSVLVKNFNADKLC